MTKEASKLQATATQVLRSEKKQHT